MNKQELVEELAAVEHARWAGWQQHLHSKCNRRTMSDGLGGYYLVIPQAYVEALERQIATPYAELSESEKQGDREQVARYWPLITGFFAEWLIQKSKENSRQYPWRLYEQWREEMQG